MTKLCLTCGSRDDDGCWETCAYCGEGSWMPLPDESVPEARPEPKRSKRDRKADK